MSKQARVSTDPQTLKPIVEAMIFASEEPLSARALIRFLVGDRDDERPDEAPPLAAMMESVETTVDIVDEAEVDTEPVSTPVVEYDAESVETIDDDDAPAAEDVPEPDSDEALAAEAAPAEADDIDESTASDDADANEPADDAETTDGIQFAEMAGLAEVIERVETRATPRLEGPRPLDHAYIRALIAELNDEYEESGRVFRIVEVAGGFQFATIREFGEFVAMLSKEKLRRRLSPAALETLAIIAYRQPVSKPEVEAIRGVNCDQVLVNLMEKNLIAITGRSEGVGRPLLYGTTDDFLRSFGLKGIGDLPKLRELEELMEDDAYSPEKIEVITVEAGTEASEIEARIGAAGHAEEGDAEDGLPMGDTVAGESAGSAADADGQVAAGDGLREDGHMWIGLAEEENAGENVSNIADAALPAEIADDELMEEEMIVEEEMAAEEQIEAVIVHDPYVDEDDVDDAGDEGMDDEEDAGDDDELDEDEIDEDDDADEDEDLDEGEDEIDEDDDADEDEDPDVDEDEDDEDDEEDDDLDDEVVHDDAGDVDEHSDEVPHDVGAA